AFARPGIAQPGCDPGEHAAPGPSAAAAPGDRRGRAAGVRRYHEGAAGDAAVAAAEFRDAGDVAVRRCRARCLRGRCGCRAADRADRPAAGHPAGTHRIAIRTRGVNAVSATMLQLDAIRVGYPTANGFHTVVDDLSLSLPPGGIGCLLG